MNKNITFLWQNAFKYLLELSIHLPWGDEGKHYYLILQWEREV